MKPKKFLPFAMLFFIFIGVKAQIVTLDECQKMARDYYPAISKFSMPIKRIYRNCHWKQKQPINQM